MDWVAAASGHVRSLVERRICGNLEGAWRIPTVDDKLSGISRAVGLGCGAGSSRHASQRKRGACHPARDRGTWERATSIVVRSPSSTAANLTPAESPSRQTHRSSTVRWILSLNCLSYFWGQVPILFSQQFRTDISLRAPALVSGIDDRPPRSRLPQNRAHPFVFLRPFQGWPSKGLIPRVPLRSHGLRSCAASRLKAFAEQH